MSQSYRQIQLPSDLCARVEDTFVGDEFDSLEELLHFLLRQAVREEAVELSVAEQELIEERLKNLGYI